MLNFLMGSDGLYRVVDDSEMADLMADHAPGEVCRRLVQRALDRGGPDNVSVATGRLDPRNSKDRSPARSTYSTSSRTAIFSSRRKRFII